jgi:GH24 family phage-related lysozyme (muramidase)
MANKLSTSALSLIIRHEGINQPHKWPQGASGVTIGYGYDLGYVTHEEFVSDWKALLPPVVFSRLYSCVGKKGVSAKALCESFSGSGFRISEKDAYQVLVNKTLPKYINTTRKWLPNFDAMPMPVQGALVSLVYNRGTSMEGENRREMKNIHTLAGLFNPKTPKAAEEILRKIAIQIRSMKRLWEDKHMGGLLKRRDEEALLVLSGIEGHNEDFISIAD